METANRSLEKVFRLLLHPAMIVLAAIAYFVLIRYIDTRWRYMPYVFASTLCISAVVYLMSRRPVFSLYFGGFVILMITAASIVKYKLKGLGLHVYDLVFTGADLSAVTFLVSSYTSIFIGALGVLVVAALFLVMLYRAEAPLGLRLRSRLALVAAGVVLPVALYPPKRVEEADYLPFVLGYNASAFLLSLGQVDVPIGQINLASRAEAAPTPDALVNSVECGAGRKPDIFMVLAETQGDLSVFPQLRSTEEITESMRSSDGRLRPLYVEVFGGGTWVTNFSVLTGLSSVDFGWQSSYVSELMEGRISGALPEVLARCGYRTITVMPMDYNFVNEGPFLKSIGMQEVYDAADIGVEPLPHFDRTYFEFAEKLIREHREKDGRPLFLAVQTMFPHTPYEKNEAWERELPDTRFSDDEKANEYIRRVALARRDMQAFVAARKADPGAQGSLVVEFGDHHSEAVRDFVFALAGGAASLGDFRSIAYRTYYAVHDLGVGVDFSKLAGGEDVPFLAARLIDAARLPTSPMFRDLGRLAEHCKGRFHTCEDRAAVDRHLRKRANGGLLRLDLKSEPQQLLASGK